MRLPDVVKALITAELARDEEAKHLSNIEQAELQDLLDEQPGEAGFGLHVIISGNPVDGIQLFGPYNNANEASEAAHTDKRLDDWWLAPLLPAYEEKLVTAPLPVSNWDDDNLPF